MFPLIRTVILVLVAFVSGLLLERSQAADRCLDAGGAMQAGLCVGASQ